MIAFDILGYFLGFFLSFYSLLVLTFYDTTVLQKKNYLGEILKKLGLSTHFCHSDPQQEDT